MTRSAAILPAALLLLRFVPAATPDEKPLYPSSVVGTDFDFIVEQDPDLFVELVSKGEGMAEMPDKTKEDAELMKPAFRFEARFRDDARIELTIDAAFETEEAAKKEALRYTPRLGRLPSALRQGVRRLVVHKGGEEATAFSDVGLIVLYSDNATKRIGTHDLEETIFHESVHAAWDRVHAESDAWRAAQKKDGGFATEYGRKNPDDEDLAESALFAFALIHHPQRIPAKDATKIRRAIPARIDFVETLLPRDKPLYFIVCQKDLTRTDPLKDVVANALTRGLDRDESAVRKWLNEVDFDTTEAFLDAVAKEFRVKRKDLDAQIEKFRHAGCKHGEVGKAVELGKS